MFYTKLLNNPDIIDHTRHYIDGVPIQFITTASQDLETYLPLIKSQETIKTVESYAYNAYAYDPDEWGVSFYEVKNMLHKTLDPLDIIYARKFNDVSPFRLDNTSSIRYDDLAPTPYANALPWTKKPDTIAHIFDALSVLDTNAKHNYSFAMAPVYQQPNKRILLLHAKIQLQSRLLADFLSPNSIFHEQGIAIVLDKPQIPLSIIYSILFRMNRYTEYELQHQFSGYNADRANGIKYASDFETTQFSRRNAIII